MFGHLAQVPNFLSGKRALESRKLVDLFRTDRLYLLVDDVGSIVFAFDQVEPHVHVTFWDRRLRGREAMCKAIGQEVMHQLGVGRLWTMIPRDARMILAFCRRVGFEPVVEVSGVVGLILPREV